MMLGQFWLSMRPSFVAVTKPFRQLLKAPGRTRSASCKALSPSYATILRALKK